MDILSIDQLSVRVGQDPDGPMIVRDVSFSIPERSIFALVGGSGSGKSTTALAIPRLLSPALTVLGGRIIFEGTDLLNSRDDEIRAVRGKKIAMVFQDPLMAFNPLLTVGYQIQEVFGAHQEFVQKDRRSDVLGLLATVGIKDPERVYRCYPHQLSGGMRQRAMIAMALVLKPRLIIADEPTSSLDVTLQARIMELFLRLREQFGLTVLLITHDLGVVRHMADGVAVMSEGRIVEQGASKSVLDNPRHEYTRKLLAYAG